MKPVLLIAVNFVREQRWPILVLLLWVLLLAVLGLVSDVFREREDILFVFKQMAVYAVASSVFFSGSAIHNERKSRRILAVLAKAVSRPQYLSGLALGVVLACGIYCFALGLTGSWILQQAGFPILQVWFLMVSLMVACMLAGSVVLMFSTFLNPFLSFGATALVLILPAFAGQSVWWKYSIPVYPLIEMVLKASFESPWDISWLPVGGALLEAAAFWLLAAQIFSRLDIAVAVE